MKINELKIVSAKDLNESLAKTFGTKLRLEDFTNEQLEDARNTVSYTHLTLPTSDLV